MSTPNAPHGLTLVEQLRALAGVREDVNVFEIFLDGCRIRVLWSPGSTDSLDLYVPVPTPPPNEAAGARRAAGGYRGAAFVRPLIVPRPMRITLREETAEDRSYKVDGVNRECQTGDEGFDARIYIDSPSEDQVIREVLASPNARAAILDLVGKDCRSLLIDDGNGDIAVGIIEFAQRAPDQTRAERLVQNLASLALSLPPVRSSGEEPADPTSGPVAAGCLLGLVGMVAAPLIYFAVSPDHCVESDGEGSSLVCSAGPECCTPGFIGATGGILMSIPLILLFAKVIRGRSDSYQRRWIAQCAVFVVLVELGVIVARLAW